MNNYCRTCLSKTSLKEIFQNKNFKETCTTILYNISGLKIKHYDGLPQLICTTCIKFINKYIAFRRMCQKSYKILLKQMKNTKIIDPKEREMEIENQFSKDRINFEEYKDICNKDSDDNDSYDNIFNKDSDQDDENITHVEYESAIHDILKMPFDIIFKNSKLDRVVRLNHFNNKRRDEETSSFRESNNDITESFSKVNEDIDGGIEEKLNGEDCVKCEQCGKTFKSKVSLKNHYKIHRNTKIICEHCGKMFMNKRRLLMHCKAKHGYEKTDKCTYCDYRGSNAELVKIHERLHTGEKPYVCAKCGAGFHRKSSYAQHLPIHLTEKKFQCDECPARFKSVTLMRIHKSRHNKFRRYSFVCSNCRSRFATRRDCVKHVARLHADANVIRVSVE